MSEMAARALLLPADGAALAMSASTHTHKYHTQQHTQSHTKHAVDLMFSHPEDSEGIKSARQAILAEVRRWVGAPPPSLAADSGRHAAVAAAAAQEASTAVV